MRSAIGAWNDRDVDGFLGCFDEACEVTFPPDVPEPGPFRGRDELRSWVLGFLAAWERYSAEIVELDVGPSEVFLELHLGGVGTGSSIEIEQTDFHLMEVERGVITRWRNYADRDAALAERERPS